MPDWRQPVFEQVLRLDLAKDLALLSILGRDDLGAVDGAREDPDELFDRAHSAEQGGDIAEAERLYRLLMKSDPTDASAPFNLGNMLRAAARTVEAEAALRAATRDRSNLQSNTTAKLVSAASGAT